MIDTYTVETVDVLLCVYLVRITYLCKYIIYLPIYNNEGVLYYEPEYATLLTGRV